MTHKKKQQKRGLTEYYRKKMNSEDVAKWVEENKDGLANAGSLTIQADPYSPNKEIWYLKFEFEKK